MKSRLLDSVERRSDDTSPILVLATDFNGVFRWRSAILDGVNAQHILVLGLHTDRQWHLPFLQLGSMQDANSSAYRSSCKLHFTLSSCQPPGEEVAAKEEEKLALNRISAY